MEWARNAVPPRGGELEARWYRCTIAALPQIFSEVPSDRVFANLGTALDYRLVGGVREASAFRVNIHAGVTGDGIEDAYPLGLQIFLDVLAEVGVFDVNNVV